MTPTITGPVTLADHLLDLAHDRALPGVASADTAIAHGPEDAAVILTLTSGRRLRVAVTDARGPG